MSMSPSLTSHTRFAGFAAALLSLAGAALLLLAPAQAQAASSCTEDNQNGCVELSPTPPQATTAVPPNIVLMLDDSGSMGGGLMRTYSPSCTTYSYYNHDCNGLFYSPDTLYSPPPKADGSLYDSYTYLTQTTDDGFRDPGTDDSAVNFSDDYFYFIDPATGQVHLILANGVSCPGGYTCTPASDTNGAAAPVGVRAGTNVANWYAYYHTRMLMAKTSVMVAFSSLSENYRVGFASINGGGSIPTPRYTGWGEYNTNEMAKVQPFDDTWRQKFWNWLENEKASGNTPLRRSLQGIGDYYKDEDQPWETMKGDPNFGTVDENKVLACRQSYAIFTTDGYWNGPAPDAKVKNAASDDDGFRYTDPAGNEIHYLFNKQPFSSSDDNGVISGSSLADVAAWYWKQDLRPEDNVVPTSDNDPAFWQHMTTFTLSMGETPSGLEGTAPSGNNPPTMDEIFAWAHDGGGSSSTKKITSFSWGTDKIADLAHAAVAGHGDFFLATSPQAVADAFAEALSQIALRNAAPTPGAANSSVATVGALTFNAGYNTTNWTGTFQAVTLEDDGSAGAVQWDMGVELDAAYHGSGYSNRDVYTATYSGVDCTNPLVPTGGSFATGVAFDATVASSLDCWQEIGLLTPVPTVSGDTATTRIQYLLGDETHEGTWYRTRHSLLGAIIKSGPVYVGNPSGGWDDSWPAGSAEAAAVAATPSYKYSDFVSAHADRASTKGTVFVGANDGMLHAFAAPAPDCDFSDLTNVTCVYDANGGKERWAYVPRAVYANLGNLTAQDFSYVPTVDARPTTLDVFFEGDDLWHTVLVGGVGLGGRGIYALDVTDPTAFDATDVLWEFDSDMVIDSSCVTNDGTSCQASDLGYTVSNPQIVRLHLKDGSHNGDWVVLVPNGYFPDCTSGTVPTGESDYAAKPQCKAIAAEAPSDYSALFVVDVENGSVIAELKTPSLTGVTSFGLGSPVVGDYNADGTGEVAFAGDLMGNVWRFDLSDPNPSNWNVTLTYKGMSGTDASGNPIAGVQPITVKPRLFPAPRSNRFMVVFGTGEYIGVDDNRAEIPVQSIYGVIEQESTTATRADLQEQTVSENSDGLRSISDQPLVASDKGWYIDLDLATAEGERVVVTPAALFSSNAFIISTLIPGETNYCNPSTQGALMCLSANNGGPGCTVSGSYIGIRVTEAPTSGNLVLVTTMGGGNIIVPGITPEDDDPDPADPGIDEPPTFDGLPIWRRRSWHVLETGG